jgi:hypothetical protein
MRQSNVCDPKKGVVTKFISSIIPLSPTRTILRAGLVSVSSSLLMVIRLGAEPSTEYHNRVCTLRAQFGGLFPKHFEKLVTQLPGFFKQPFASFMIASSSSSLACCVSSGCRASLNRSSLAASNSNSPVFFPNAILYGSPGKRCRVKWKRVVLVN